MLAPDVDMAVLSASFRFCVYMHKRPDGSVFYIGKGLKQRAYDLSPSRRTIHHKNIVNKYGKANIGITVIPCMSECEALALEKAHISIARFSGVELVNLTNGGEGVSGHKATDKQLEALAKGRRVGKRGVCGSRPQLEKWKITSEGKAHLKWLGEQGKVRLHSERTINCAECGVLFKTKSAQARCCSRLCEQRFRRAGKNKP